MQFKLGFKPSDARDVKVDAVLAKAVKYLADKITIALQAEFNKKASMFGTAITMTDVPVDVNEQ